MRTLTQFLTRTIATPTILTLTIPLWLLGCAASASPAELDPKNDQCGTCRMVVSTKTTASQIVAPNHEPKFFDDFGCLDQFLAANSMGTGARVFVADHRNGEWVPVESAVFTKVATGAGAMGSPFVAHASAASRDADRRAAGVNVPAATVLPSLHVSGGPR